MFHLIILAQAPSLAPRGREQGLRKRAQQTWTVEREGGPGHRGGLGMAELGRRIGAQTDFYSFLLKTALKT